jgi:hypothetical protein
MFPVKCLLQMGEAPLVTHLLQHSTMMKTHDAKPVKENSVTIPFQ